MKIEVRYFARVREALGPGQSLNFEADAAAPATVGELRVWLARQSAAHAQALAPSQAVRSACNQAMCGADQPLSEGVEVAFFFRQ